MNSNGFTLRIGGIGLHVDSDIPIELNPSPAYEKFIERGASGSGCDVSINLVPGAGPVLDGTQIFDSEGAWSMYRCPDDTRCIVNTLDGEHLWTAIMDCSASTITVHCGERLQRDGCIVNPVRYPLDQIIMMYALAGRGIILHACGAIVDGRGFVFPGKSGAGKSTIAGFLDGAGNVRVLSDDRIIVSRRSRETGDASPEFVMWGTPWHGDAGISESESVPLDSIMYLSKAKSNALRPLDQLQVVERMLPIASVPWHDMDVLPGVLGFCDDLTTAVGGSELCFKRTAKVVDVIRGGALCA